MNVEWFGQSAFALRGEGGSVFIDPFADVSALEARGITFEYPAITAEGIDLLLVTHEHMDHNSVEAIAGEPHVVRSTAGTHETPLGEVIGVASEHDDVAGTQRGPNTIFVFELDGVRVAHFGDFGQSELRPAQADAIGSVDLLFIPVGDGPTIGADAAAAIAARLQARWIVPMHYRTPRVGFLEPADAFLELMPNVRQLESTAFELDPQQKPAEPVVLVPAVP
ncbi:MAG: hypothetical protein QOG62_2089 [Thermoleophilaceae bacterium]|nr:hypothetical protein [Thermoleophilaceae bacterium]